MIMNTTSTARKSVSTTLSVLLALILVASCGKDLSEQSTDSDTEESAPEPGSYGTGEEDTPAIAISIPWLNAGENDDLTACAAGDVGACDSMKFPGLLDERTIEYIAEQCRAGRDPYCDLHDMVATTNQDAVGGDDGVARTECFRNEYAFDDKPAQKDVEELIIDINGNRASGAYNWIPVYKDKRLGRFKGSIQGDKIIAEYEFMQEGVTTETTITISRKKDRAIVEGVGPDVGLNATIARVEC